MKRENIIPKETVENNDAKTEGSISTREEDMTGRTKIKASRRSSEGEFYRLGRRTTHALPTPFIPSLEKRGEGAGEGGPATDG